jgi:GTP cyclohydrolase IA
MTSQEIENVFPLQRPAAVAMPREIPAEDWARYTGYVGEIFQALGMELDTPGTERTPERFLEALYEATSGYDGDPKLSTLFPAEARRRPESELAQIVEGPIAFHALCEHHALPFHGFAYVGYIARDSIIGISKLTRLVRLYARRFTVQERLAEQIADTLVELVDPHGVAVYLSAEHLCTHMRGVEEPSSTVTTGWRGAYRDADLRREFLDQARRSAKVGDR